MEEIAPWKEIYLDNGLYFYFIQNHFGMCFIKKYNKILIIQKLQIYSKVDILFTFHTVAVFKTCLVLLLLLFVQVELILPVITGSIMCFSKSRNSLFPKCIYSCFLLIYFSTDMMYKDSFI